MTGRRRKCSHRVVLWCAVGSLLVFGLLSNLSVLDGVHKSWPAHLSEADNLVTAMRRRPLPFFSGASDVSTPLTRAAGWEPNVVEFPRPVNEGLRCSNTGQSSLVTDSEGYTCSAATAGIGCCKERSNQYSCRSCSASSRCCSTYELCVSCCMGPDQRAVLESVRSRSAHVVISQSEDPFELCTFKCRTSSGSVVHENSYRNTQVSIRQFLSSKNMQLIDA